jgi:undecaprenyl-diphosphatase
VQALPPFLERRVLVAVLAVAAGLWAVFAIGDAVLDGAGAELDRRLLLSVRGPTRAAEPAWLEEAARDITALGGWTVLTLVTVAAAGSLLLAGRRRQALVVLAAIVGASLLADAIKDLVERPRPDLVPHAVTVSSSSFPSGHATQAAACYLTLGALLARFQPRRRLKSFTIMLAVAVTAAVGASRVVLGVHWPSDVVAGWALGASWALLCWAVVRALQRRGAVERTDQVASNETPS